MIPKLRIKARKKNKKKKDVKFIEINYIGFRTHDFSNLKESWEYEASLKIKSVGGGLVREVNQCLVCRTQYFFLEGMVCVQFSLIFIEGGGDSKNNSRKFARVINNNIKNLKYPICAFTFKLSLHKIKMPPTPHLF